jgi:PAS domain S-box-containing protein
MHSGRTEAAAPSRAEVPFLNRMWVKLVVGGMSLVILSIAITAGFTVQFAAGELRRSVQKSNEQIARRTADAIETFVIGAHRELEEIADVMQIVRRAPWVGDVLLQNNVMTGGIFETVAAVDHRGKLLADDSLGDVDLARFTREALARAATGAEWRSPVTFDSRGLPGMAFVVPMGRDAALLGELPLERIWGLVDEIDAGPGGSAFVLSEDGTLIASPDKAAVLRGVRPSLPGDLQAGSNLLVSSPVSLLGWTVYIEQPIAQAFFPVSLVLRRSLLLVLLALSLTFSLGVIVARLYARSLDALLRGTARIAEGDLGYRIPAGGSDEFGVLSRSFNEMVGRLALRTSALEESEVRYRRVTEGVGDIIYSLDRQGRFTFVNSRVKAILGMSPDEMLGRPMTDFVVPWQRARKAEDLRNTFSGVRPSGQLGEARAVARDGREVILEYESNNTIGPSGEALIHGIARDVTQRRALEEKLRRSERLAALGEIVSRVAHELRNAVAGIAASMTLARARGSADGVLEQELDRALSEAQRAQTIVEGLLETSPRRPASFQRCSLSEALESVLDARRGDIEAGRIIVRRDLAPDLPVVMADRDQLRQVFHNIVDNAQHALAGTGGVINARTGVRGRRVFAEISDTGPGIPEEHIGRIFDPFYTTRSESGGTGLGLAISLGIVEASGGDMSVRNVPGEGAAFAVELPAAEDAAPESDGRGLRGRRVLVVEDEPVLRDFIHHYVESLGCQMQSAASGAEAMAILGSGAGCDLVISDMRMPDGDGKALYAWMRSSRPELLSRLIYVTGDSMNQESRTFLERSGVPYLLKPVVAAVLEEEVRRVLGERAR